ncbi:glycosyltransferase family 4 protein [Streptomyces sp. NBC_01591]|uniref:glycosyltransferase family 4 protein n=1 Tax=Streptomyces sp. NBC_01591 TaxID=2975888 RepID=UPI002DDBB394|nr:glycosyltransferase family 4 protein [Streptomyces sp. NBC_01591]WSD68349.1 glycosyltransferase family 4 protein [Streptomyces sp. NBC_01591]
MPRTLIVTNDFPPRQGGIETFVHAMAARFPPDRVAVYTSSSPGDRSYDAGLPFPVVRDRTHMLLPTPRVTARAARLAQELDCDSVWFGAAAPLGLMAGELRRRTAVERLVATTHGHEVWWARTPGARALLHRIGAQTDSVTYLGSYTRQRIASAIGPKSAARMSRLAPGVDPDVFRCSGEGAARVRDRYRLGTAPVVLCAARLIPRKGQDTLIHALRLVRQSVPDAVLLLVGTGPYEGALRRLAAKQGLTGSVIFAGGHPHEEMPDFYAAAQVFAMPCRTRRAGMEVEGLGIVFLEAAAAGLPVVVGESGGAPDAVQDGESGFVVDGNEPRGVADRLTALLSDAESASRMGAKGREWVRREWGWDTAYSRLAELLKVTGECAVTSGPEGSRLP